MLLREGVEYSMQPLGPGFGLRWGGGKGEEMKHQTPSESPTGAGDHRGLVLGISPPPPEHRGTIDDDSDDEDDENDDDEDDENGLENDEDDVLDGSSNGERGL